MAPKPHHYDLIIKLFPQIMGHSYNNGMKYVGDPYLISLGFPISIDSYGNEKIKTFGISQECQQRAKVLTGDTECELRFKREEEIELQAKRRVEEGKAKVDQKRDDDQRTVDSLCTAAQLPSSRENLKHCTLSMFAEPCADALRDFISGRHVTITTKTATKHLKKPRGKKFALQEAKAGVENLISVAYDVRTNKSRWLNEPVAIASTEVAAAPMYISPTITPVVLNPTKQDIKPSSILGDLFKLEALRKMMDSKDVMKKNDAFHQAHPIPLSTHKLMAKADLLSIMLQLRLRSHISVRVMTNQQEHWCLEWARKNLSVVAAYMVYFNHIVMDIRCLDGSDCLLANPNNDCFVVVSAQTSPLFGCYLHFDGNRGVWIRSGSATGEGGFGKRLGTHEKRAKADRNDDDSQFYRLFPHSDSVRANSRATGGIFQYLTPFIAAYFTNDAASRTDFSNSGLFLYTNEEKRRISSVNFSGKSGEKKYLQMIAYLFELGYDLAISPRCNVSKSPGFEGCGLNVWKTSSET